MKRTAIFVVCLLVTVLSAACIKSKERATQFPPSPPSQASTVHIGIATWPGFAVGMVGQEKGFFGNLKLDHKILDDATSRHAAFQSGLIDMMISSADVFAQEVAQGIQGQVILVTDESAGGDGIVAKTTIKSVADLKGKSVSFARGTPSHYLLYTALKKAGLSIKDVKQQVVEDPGSAGNAFIGGKVDAAVTFEPLLSQVVVDGKGRVLLTSKDYPGTIVDVIVVSDKLAAQPDVIREFLNGWMKSVDYIDSHRSEAGQIMAKGLNLKDEDVQGMMMGLAFADRAYNADFLSGSNPLLVEKYLDAATLWKQEGVISVIPPITHLVSPVAKQYFSK